MDILKRVYIAELQKCCIELEDLLKSLKGYEETDLYNRTSALLNDVWQEYDNVTKGV